MGAERQSTTVERTPEGQIRVWHEWITSDGLDMSGEFVFEASATDWLTEYLLKAADDDLPQTEEASMPPDLFRVYIGGGHRYDDINVNASNQRDPAAPHGKLYVLTGLPCNLARTLVDQIRHCLG